MLASDPLTGNPRYGSQDTPLAGYKICNILHDSAHGTYWELWSLGVEGNLPMVLLPGGEEEPGED